MSGDIGGKFARREACSCAMLRGSCRSSGRRRAVVVGRLVGVESRCRGKLLLGCIPRLRSFSAWWSSCPPCLSVACSSGRHERMGKKTGCCRRGSVSVAGRGSGASLAPVSRASCVRTTVRGLQASVAVEPRGDNEFASSLGLRCGRPGLTYAGVKVKTTGSVGSTAPASSSRWD
jgi:hypothetical protein